jgi:hypothetical protein
MEISDLINNVSRIALHPRVSTAATGRLVRGGPHVVRAALGDGILTSRLPVEEVDKWETRYDYWPVDDAQRAADEMRDGQRLTVIGVQEIVHWKTRGRADHHAKTITADQLRKATKAVFDAQTSWWQRVEALDGVNGIGVAVATMILHLMYPGDVAAVDRYVQRCFGMTESLTYTAIEWHLLQRSVKAAAANAGRDLRFYDRALWKYGKERLGCRVDER